MYKMNVMLFLIAFLFDPTASLYSQISLKASTGTANGIYTTIRTTFTAINAGTHSGNNFWPDDSANVLVNVQDSSNWLGLDELTGTNVALYPNPTTGEATINYSLMNAAKVAVNVVDITGKTIYTTSVAQNTGANSITFDATSFTSGVYYVTVATEGSTVTKKLIKK